MLTMVYALQKMSYFSNFYDMKVLNLSVGLTPVITSNSMTIAVVRQI